MKNLNATPTASDGAAWKERVLVITRTSCTECGCGDCVTRECDTRGFDGEVFEAVTGAAIDNEVAEGVELGFVLGGADAEEEEEEEEEEDDDDDDVAGVVVMTVFVFPNFELDVDVASEITEDCPYAIPVKRFYFRVPPGAKNEQIVKILSLPDAKSPEYRP